MRGRIIYLKCEKGWLWSTSWKERQLGPSNEYEVYTNSALWGSPISIDEAKAKIAEELEQSFFKELYNVQR